MGSLDRGSSVPLSLDSLLLDTAERHGDRATLTFSEQSITYRELEASVAELSRQLGELGVKAGDRVAALAPNTPALVTALFAVWRAGAVAVPLNARLREYEIGRILRDADAGVLISAASYRGYSFAGAISDLLPDLPGLGSCLFVNPLGQVEETLAGQGEPSEAEPLGPTIAAILYTSGTTGAPKGALVTHAREVSGARAMGDVLSLGPDDVGLYVVPISHAFGLTCFLASVAAGARAVLVDSTFSPEPMLAAGREEQASILFGSPALYTSFLKVAPDGVPSVRAGLVAGASCPPDVLRRLDDAGMRVLNLFGMTEIGAAASCRLDDPPEVRYTSVGRPLSGYEIRTAAGGEIEVRGPHVTPGYYRQPERTAEAFDGGWFRTGDLGAIDDAGYVHISGRAKEVVHVAGLSVFPAEVEGFLLTHPDIVQVAVIGVPHETMGEALEAFIVPRPGAVLTPPQVLQFARPRIAGYKLPYVIHIVPELPQLASGKPDRMALTQSAGMKREEGGHADTGAGAHSPL